jgi:hypothetical protein
LKWSFKSPGGDCLLMPDFIQSLQGRDFSHLNIVAELWGVELEASNAKQGLQQLAKAVLDAALIEETLEVLPDAASLAWQDLRENQGRISWPLFTRRYGEVREMGPARRDREKPYLKNPSPAETLWYRALVARAFFDTPEGPQEFAYIPSDLLALLAPLQGENAAPLGRLALPAERAKILLAEDRLLDQACTLLAALRLEMHESWYWEMEAGKDLRPVPIQALKMLLTAAGILDHKGFPNPETSKEILEASRGQALVEFAQAWLQSEFFNELRLLPGLSLDGDWKNDPLRARSSILALLANVPRPSWWSLDSFVEAIRTNQPDFQRPAGDYDSWFIRDAESGEYLRGFEHWERVDGALIRYIVQGPMHWLGLVDLGLPERADLDEIRSSVQAPVTAFRFSGWAESLMSGIAPETFAQEEEEVIARSDARIQVPRLAARDVRYQLARFSAWEGRSHDLYRYRLTPTSLENARQQGLRLEHLIAILNRHAAAVPPSLVAALERWKARGVEVNIQGAVILRVKSPAILQKVRDSRAARFLGDPLGPTSVIVNPGAWEKVLSILAEMGFLGQVERPEELN